MPQTSTTRTGPDARGCAIPCLRKTGTGRRAHVAGQSSGSPGGVAPAVERRTVPRTSRTAEDTGARRKRPCGCGVEVGEEPRPTTDEATVDEATIEEQGRTTREPPSTAIRRRLDASRQWTSGNRRRYMHCEVRRRAGGCGVMRRLSPIRDLRGRGSWQAGAGASRRDRR